jgi:hypothetical protein
MTDLKELLLDEEVGRNSLFEWKPVVLDLLWQS